MTTPRFIKTVIFAFAFTISIGHVKAYANPVVCELDIRVEGGPDPGIKDAKDGGLALFAQGAEGTKYKLICEVKSLGVKNLPLQIKNIPDAMVFDQPGPDKVFYDTKEFEFYVSTDIANGDTNETLKLEVAGNHPWAGDVFDEIELTLYNCEACIECVLGTSAENGCVDFSLNLGTTTHGQQAGKLGIFAIEPSYHLAKPRGLYANVGLGVTVNRDSYGVITSVVGPQGTVTVSNVASYSYDLVVTDSASGAVRTITVSNPDGSSSNERLEITDDGAQDRYYLYEWSATDTEWTLKEGETSTTIERVTRRANEQLSATERQHTLTVLNGDESEVISRTAEVYETLPWGEERVRQIDDPSDSATSYVGADLTTEWYYYTDPATAGYNYGELRMRVGSDDGWTYYEYDGDNRVVRMITGLGNTAAPDLSGTVDVDVLAAANVVVETDYSELNLSDGDTEKEEVEKVTTKSAGTVREIRYEVDWSKAVTHDGSECDVFWSIEAADTDPEDGYDTTADFLEALAASSTHLGHRVSKRYRIAYLDASELPQADGLRPKRRDNADGTVALYSYPSSGVTVVERGFPNGSFTSVVHGTRTRTTVTAKGQPASTYVEMIDPAVNGGAWFTVSLTKTTDEDEFDRPEETSYYFGVEAKDEWASAGTGLASYTTSQTYGCCGVESRTDRYGLTTHYVHDELGRMICMTGPDGVTLHYTYDAAGRTTKVEREAYTGGLHGTGPKTVDATSDYDKAGRMESGSDAGGAYTFYTYRTVKSNGDPYTIGTDTGAFYWEERMYPHDASSGPVQATWADSRGRTVLSLTGSVATDWNGSAPTTVEALSGVFSRVEMDYDWAGRVEESRSYHDLSGLSLTDLRAVATPGSASAGTHYDVVVGGVYDALGRMVKSEDALGNITVSVYGAPGSAEDGRVVETWVGTDDGSPPEVTDYHDPGSLGGTSNLVQVAGSVYDSYGEMDQSLRLKPNLTTLGTFDTTSGGDAVAMDYEDDYTSSSGAVTGRESWSKPDDGLSPWTKQTYDVQGRMTLSQTYNNGGSTLLAQSEQVYDDTVNGKGRLQYSRVYEVTGGTAGNYLETQYYYDSAGRQFKTSTPTPTTTGPGSNATVTLYDDVGRVAASLVVADDNNTDTVDDDLVASETVYFYDEADRVEVTVSLSRKHDVASTQLGRLWDATNEEPVEISNVPIADARYVYTLYDVTGRVTHVADYGDTPFSSGP